jgi:hypothetical protein
MNSLMTIRKCLQLGIWVVLLVLCNSCLTSDRPQSESTDTPSSEAASQPAPASETSHTTIAKSTNDEDDEDDDNDNQAKTIADGSYTAIVDYSNPNTGYSATYTLSVEVSDGQVIQINFPNDGYLDEDHITPADIDEEGNASVEGEEGKTYDVHIDL